MACRIDLTEEATRRVVYVAGRLAAVCVPDLLGVCSASVRPLHIDLNQLVSADYAGLDALRHLRASGAQLVNVPPFIGLSLDTP